MSTTIAAYVPRDDTYHISETVQWTTLFIAAGVVLVVIWALKIVADDVIEHWSIEDAEADIDELTDDLLRGRDQHLTVPMLGSRWAS